MSKLTTFFIMRHAQSVFNARARREDIKDITYDGSLGDGLSELGKEQAKRSAEKLKDEKFDAILTSDLLRAHQTAKIIADSVGLSVKTSNLIRERSIFEYHRTLNNKDFADLSRELTEAMKNLTDEEKMQYKHTPEMESAEEGGLRLITFLRSVHKGNPGKKILIVCHGNLMRCLLNFLGFARFDELIHDSIENTGYIILDTDGEKFNVKKTVGVHKQKGAVRDF